jgi:hypothetical protein
LDDVGKNVAKKMSLASGIDASVRRQQLYLELIKLRDIADQILGKLMKNIRTLVQDVSHFQLLLVWPSGSKMSTFFFLSKKTSLK